MNSTKTPKLRGIGPGSIDVAHQPNEYMQMEQTQPAIDTLRELIRRYCV